MCSTPFPAGMRSDIPPQSLNPGTDIAMQDWDLLFDAVIARLLSSFDDIPLNDTDPRRVAWVQTRARVMDCAQALDQLHLAATHELARAPRPATDGIALVTPRSRAASAEPDPMQFDVARAVWQAWYAHLCACAGWPLDSAVPLRPPL